MEASGMLDKMAIDRELKRERLHLTRIENDQVISRDVDGNQESKAKMLAECKRRIRELEKRAKKAAMDVSARKAAGAI